MRSPLPSSAVASGTTRPSLRDRVDVERATDVLQLEAPQGDDLEIRLVPDLLVGGVRQHHAARRRKRLDPGRDVHGLSGEALRLDDHLAGVDAYADGNVQRREFTLDGDRGPNGGERTGEHAHTAVAEPLHDRPLGRVVVPLQRRPVTVALLERGSLVCLE